MLARDLKSQLTEAVILDVSPRKAARCLKGLGHLPTDDNDKRLPYRRLL